MRVVGAFFFAAAFFFVAAFFGVFAAAFLDLVGALFFATAFFGARPVALGLGRTFVAVAVVFFRVVFFATALLRALDAMNEG
jgi:hypothetical protein